jgi:hypothetical protein
MRHYLYLLTFAGLMLFVGGGCTKPVKPIAFLVNIINNCPGNKLQNDVKYQIKYLQFITTEVNPPSSAIKIIEDSVGRDGVRSEQIMDGKDLNGDGALDSGDLDGTPPDTDALCIKLDYLDDDPADPDNPDKKWNDIWVASMNTIVEGCIVDVTIDANCLASYEIKYPASDGSLGSSVESGVFQRIERTEPQAIDEDSSR